MALIQADPIATPKSRSALQKCVSGRPSEKQTLMKVIRLKVLIATAFGAGSVITIGRAADIILAGIRTIAKEGFIFGRPNEHEYQIGFLCIGAESSLTNVSENCFCIAAPHRNACRLSSG